MNHPELNKISYLTRWSFLLAIVPMLVAPLVLLPVNHAFAAQYLNSAEPMCSGSDSTVLFCDDFEDGAWYYFSGTNDYRSEEHTSELQSLTNLVWRLLLE